MSLIDDDAVLVTGFPSFRARKMVEQVLRANDKTLVYAIVHSKFADQANVFLSALERRDRERIVVYEGDAAAIDLGLSGAEYRELAARVDRVHHLAQVTYPSAQRKVAEYVNVGAMREIIE